MRKKFFIWFVAIVVAVVAGMFLWEGFVAPGLRQKRFERAMEEFNKLQREDYERAMADTYGGKTPQETLQMYIAALEKGDYELASKYFVRSKQIDEKSRLEDLSKANTDSLVLLIKILRDAKPWRSSLEDETFTMESKVDSRPSFYVEFIKYPNGIWKILEI
jgi:hypothetical protein